MVDLWVLHIDSMRRTFDRSLIKIFQRVQEIWSGQESVTEGQMDGQTDRWTDRQTKAISIIHHLLRGGGLTKSSDIFQKSLVDLLILSFKGFLFYF